MKQSKRGFTIVELVIVIAVIAVLAAVLIPTFSSLIKKANLSADMQAVREMNIALAAYENLHGKPDDVETVMQVLADAGYHTDGWKTLTKGYEVYWYKSDNRMVLYSTKESKLIYPTEYDPGMFLDQRNSFWMYNQNTRAAETADTAIHSTGGGGKTKGDISSSASETGKAAIESIDTAVAGNIEVRNALGIADGATVYFHDATELTNNVAAGTTVNMYVTEVSDSVTPTLTSSGDVEANMIYISIHASASATASEILAAQKAASEYVYTAFVQINSAKFKEDVTIMLPAGTEINASAHEWKPVKHFSGYFGTTNADAPIIINGAKLSDATGYLDSVYFDGSGGKYFVTGFFGCVYGEATIENVIFRNLIMDEPAKNYDMSLTDKQHSRNSIGIVGGVIDDPAAGTSGSSVTNVTLRNIVVESNCTIKGAATASGLVGYVGASGESEIVNKNPVKRRLFNGTLVIENCHVSAEVIGGPETSTYGPVGGLIGFTCRCQEEDTGKDSANDGELYNIIIRNCSYDGKCTGYQGVGSAVGDMITGLVVFEGENDFSGATLTSVDPAGSNMVGTIGRASKVASVVIYFSTGTLSVGTQKVIGCLGNPGAAAQTTFADVDTRTAANKYDTIKKGDDNIGGNDGHI